MAPLKHRNYALYIVGFAASNSGRWIEQTGAVWLVYELTASPALVGLMGVARAVPLIMLSPIAGVIVDRIDQRRLLLVTQALALASSLVLGLVVLAGLAEVWHVYLLVAIQAAISAFDWAVRQALFPRLVPPSLLGEVVTLQAVAARSSAFVGPAIGGVVIGSLGVAGPFFLNALTFLVLIGAVAWMRGVDGIVTNGATSFRADLLEGIHQVRGDPVLNSLLKMEVVFSVFQINAVMIAVIGREVLDVGPTGLGGLLSAPAFGALIGYAFLLVRGPVVAQWRFLVGCTFGYAAAYAILGSAHHFVIAFASIALAGCCDSLVTVTRNEIAHRAAPPQMRGRVMANIATITRGIGPLSEAQAGALSGAVGVPIATIIAAAALATMGGGMARSQSARPH